jgi:hypothetical protein
MLAVQLGEVVGAFVANGREMREGVSKVKELVKKYAALGKAKYKDSILSNEVGEVVIYAPKRAGRRGNQATRDHIDQVRDDFLDTNPDYKHVAGGRDRVTGAELPEEYLPGPGGGRKGSSYPDLTFEGSEGSRIRINTTDSRVDGTMTPREQRNFDRIFDQTNEPIIGIPKPK